MKKWEIAPLGKYVRFIDYRGKTPTKTEKGIRLITAKNVRLGSLSLEPMEFIDPSAYDSWMTRGIPKIGDVLFTTEAPLANVAQLDTEERVAFAQRIIIFQPQRDKIDPTFLKYLFLSDEVRGDILSHATGATVKGIKASTLKNIEIPLPPLSEQKRIAGILDAADGLRQQGKTLIGYYNQLAQSVFLEMFGDPVRNERGWEVKELGEIVKNENNLRIPLKQGDREKRHGQFPYYGASGIIDTIDDFTHNGERLLIGEDGANLITRSSPIAFIAKGKFWVNNHAHVLATNGHTNLRFLEFFLNLIDLKPFVTGSAQPKLTRGNLDEIKIPYPPLALQQKFAAVIEHIEQQKAQAEASLQQSESLFQSLLQAAFKGNL